MTKGCAWRRCLDVLQDIQAASKAQGNEIFFGLESTSETTAEFRTWQAKRDRTSSGTSPIIFSKEFGNLANGKLIYDYTDTRNAIYAGGQGHESERVIQLAEDESQLKLSRLARVEGFVQSQSDDEAFVLDDAKNEIERQRAKITVSGDLISTRSTPYGGHGWQIGDKVTASTYGKQFNVFVRAVNVKVSSSGKEMIKSKIENE